MCYSITLFHDVSRNTSARTGPRGWYQSMWYSIQQVRLKSFSTRNISEKSQLLDCGRPTPVLKNYTKLNINTTIDVSITEYSIRSFKKFKELFCPLMELWIALKFGITINVNFMRARPDTKFYATVKR